MIASQQQTVNARQAQFMRNFAEQYRGEDPARVLRSAAQAVIDYNMRQTHSDRNGVDLSKIFELRHEFFAMGLLVLDEREKDFESFAQRWRQIRLDRDLGREILDCATYLRTIMNRHRALKHRDPFWFYPKAGQTWQKVFKWDESIEPTKRNFQLMVASAMRSAPPQSLVKSVDYFCGKDNFAKHALPQEADRARMILGLFLYETRRRLKRLGLGAKDIPRKPPNRRIRENADPLIPDVAANPCPYASAKELEFAGQMAALMAMHLPKDVWIIGSEDYLKSAPVPFAREKATRAHRTENDQAVLDYGVRVEARKRVAAKGRNYQRRDRLGRFGPNDPATIRLAKSGRETR